MQGLNLNTSIHHIHFVEDLTIIDTVASIGTAIATIALVFLLYRAIQQMETTVKLSRVQTEYRFRPWIGPVTGITKMINSVNEHHQFEITIKNFGEIPASAVSAKFTMDSTLIQREDAKSKSLQSYDLGPMLPNMEKHYWFFIESEKWEKIETGSQKLFTSVYFDYKGSTGKSGYGMISEYNPSSKKFIHKEMWIDDSY